MTGRDGTATLGAAVRQTLVGERDGVTMRADAELLPSTPLDEDAWRRVLTTAQEHRVTGSLLAAVLRDGLPVTQSQREQLLDVHVAAMSTALLLDRQLARVTRLLDDAGVESVALKGPAVAHLDYDAPWLRAYGDIDLLLRSEQLDHAYAVLLAAGYERPATRLGSAFDRRFGKGATLVGPDRLELDVHRTFVFGALGVAIDPDDLFGSVETFTVGDTKVAALDRANRYLHACYHAAVGTVLPRWSTLCDVVQLHPTDASSAEQVLDTARRWGGLGVLARAHRLVTADLGLELAGPVVDAAAAHRPAAREQRAIETYVGDRRTFAAQVVATLPYLPSLADRVRFLWAVGMPDRASIASRGSGGRLAWIARGIRSLGLGGRR